MNKYAGRAKLLAVGLALSFSATFIHAAEEHDASEAMHAYIEYGRHHLSSFGGWTNVDGGNYATGSIEYEYRLNSILGIGAIVEHAGGAFNAESYMATLDFHPFETGVILQFGIGKEFRTVFEHAEEGVHHIGEPAKKGSEVDERVSVGRAGILYEFEFGRFTLAPQAHWDYHHNEPNSMVYGFSAGVNF